MNIFSEQIKFIDSLPESIKNSLEWYTDEYNYKKFNNMLRTDEKLDEDQKTHLENINLAFLGVPSLTESIIVYRGIKGFEIADEKLFQDKAYVSTSLNPELIKRIYVKPNRECCLLQITISAGTKVLPLHTISQFNEQEVLLNRNGTYIITFSNIIDNYKVLYITYVPEHSVVIDKNLDIKTAQHDFDRELANSLKND